MAMRPALKKIVKLLKESKSLMDVDGYYAAVKDTSKFEKFIKKHCIRLRNPVPIKAGTKWTSKSNSGTIHGKFKVDCKAIGVVLNVGPQIVLDKRSSISNQCEELNGRLDYLEQLSSLDTDLLEKTDKALCYD